MAPRQKRKHPAPKRTLSKLMDSANTVENQLNNLPATVLTDSMMKRFKTMAEALSCPLCNQVIENPQTLAACAHSFCMICIDEYSCNNWQCPVPGCGQSITLRGSRQGKFRKTNPSLETIATSWKAIHQALTRAPPQWWKEENLHEQNCEFEKIQSKGDASSKEIN